MRVISCRPVRSFLAFISSSCSWVVAAAPGPLSPDREVRELTELLGQRLPRYMIPNVFHRMEAMPMTASGKADRVGLKERFT